MYSNLFPLFRVLMLGCLLYSSALICQNDSIIALKHYWNGQRKEVLILKNKDTIDYKKFNEYGRVIEHTTKLKLDNINTKLLMKELFYQSGKIFIRTIYGEDRKHYTEYNYRRDGKVRLKLEKPYGHYFRYNKKGELIEFRYTNKFDDAVFPKRSYSTQKHLNPSLLSRIKTKKAYLTNNTSKVNISQGAFVSIKIDSDTNLIEMCQVEGFTGDTLVLSKFSFNKDFKMFKGEGKLIYDSTFTITSDRLNLLSYSKRFSRARELGALTARVTALEFMFFPFVFALVSPATLVPMLPFYGTMFISGIALRIYSNFLYKTEVPKTYSMSNWRIVSLTKN